MSNKFKDHLFRPLHACERNQLIGVVELARLSPASHQRYWHTLRNQSWSILQQPELAHLQPYGACLCSHRPDATLHAKNDFYGLLTQVAEEALCGWIISSLPAEPLLIHLMQANHVIAPDGESYLLRFHIPHSLQVLHARQDLPGLAQWWAPVHSWWIPIGIHGGAPTWSCLPGHDRPPATDSLILELDEPCWEALAGDPLSQQLTEQLKAFMSTPTKAQTSHSICLGRVQQHLSKARELGLTRQTDLGQYVTCMVLGGAGLPDSPAWQKALDDARNQTSTLAQALQVYLRHPNTR